MYKNKLAYSKAVKNASSFTGVLLSKPRLVSEKVTYLNMQNVGDGKKLQWVVFNANFDKADLKKLQFAEPETIITIFGTDNVNKQTGQHQIVVQQLLSVSDATDADTFTSNDASSDILNDLLMGETVTNAQTDTPQLIASTWNQLNALVAKLPKQTAIGMLAKQIIVLNGETPNA